MRNGKHYVQVRMTKSEKENFLRLSKLCNAPEKTVLYWLVNDMIVYEKPPETFFKITRLMLRLQISVDHIWLSHNYMSEATQLLSTTALSGMWKYPRCLKGLALKQTPEKALPWSISPSHFRHSKKSRQPPAHT